jgi:hypothetical protein
VFAAIFSDINIFTADPAFLSKTHGNLIVSVMGDGGRVPKVTIKLF